MPRRALLAAGKVLATSDPEAKVEQLVQQALSQSDGLELDYARDVEPWLGSKAGFWLARMRSGGQARGAAVLASTDEDAAKAAMARAVKGSGEPFTKRSYKDVEYDVNDQGGAVGVADDYVVVGSEAELRRTLDVLDGGDSLGASDRYAKAVAPLSDDRLGTAYLDVKAFIEAAAAQNPAAAAQFQQLQRMAPMGSLGPVAVQFTADGSRLAAEGVFHAGKAYADQLGAGSAPLIKGLPGDSWLAIGAPKFGEGLRNGYQSAAAGLGGAVIEQQLESQLGLDLRQDVLSWIGDVAFFARGDSAGSVEGAAVISVTDEVAARSAFGKLVGLAQTRGGVAARPVPVKGAESAFAFTVPGAPKPVVAARGKGKVVIAFGAGAAADALSPAQTMADSPAYAAAAAALGDGIEPGFVLAMAPVVSLIESASRDKAELARAKPYLDAFSVIAAGAKVDGDTARSRFVAGLK